MLFRSLKLPNQSEATKKEARQGLSFFAFAGTAAPVAFDVFAGGAFAAPAAFAGELLPPLQGSSRHLCQPYRRPLPRGFFSCKKPLLRYMAQAIHRNSPQNALLRKRRVSLKKKKPSSGFFSFSDQRRCLWNPQPLKRLAKLFV